MSRVLWFHKWLEFGKEKRNRNQTKYRAMTDIVQLLDSRKAAKSLWVLELLNTLCHFIANWVLNVEYFLSI